jgi:hypothetical protein
MGGRQCRWRQIDWGTLKRPLLHWVICCCCCCHRCRRRGSFVVRRQPGFWLAFSACLTSNGPTEPAANPRGLICLMTAALQPQVAPANYLTIGGSWRRQIDAASPCFQTNGCRAHLGATRSRPLSSSPLWLRVRLVLCVRQSRHRLGPPTSPCCLRRRRHYQTSRAFRLDCSPSLNGHE